MSISKIFQYRVYYEDTDAGGVVYYANYLRYAERARTDFLREVGIIQSQLKDAHDILFVVRHVDMQLIKPARLDDIIHVETVIEELNAASLVMKQEITTETLRCAKLEVEVVCVDGLLKPKRLPQFIRELLV